MSSNVEIVRESCEVFNRRDLEAVIDHSHPAIEIEDLPETNVFSGLNGLREFLKLNLEPWEAVTLHIERLIEVGDDVVVIGRNSARGRSSGLLLEEPRGVTFSVRDGKVARVRFFADHAAALEAAGLTTEQKQS